MDKRRFDGLRERAPRLHRFLTSDDRPFPVLREVTVGALLVLLVLGTLWGYTGQPIGRSPVVVVESGSMMHCENGNPDYGVDCKPERYGRLGFIDPGDLILVKDIDGRKDVPCRADGGEGHYGRDGEVIIYRPDGRSGTPIIHRCLFWLQMNADSTFTIEALGLHNVRDLNQPEVTALGLPGNYAATMRDRSLDAVCGPVGPERSGFITRGDNNAGGADQGVNTQSIATCPVKVAWVLGIARGEIPWLGLVKLLANDLMSGTENFARAGNDSKLLLFVTLGVLLGGPVVFEKVRAHRREKREIEEHEGPFGPT